MRIKWYGTATLLIEGGNARILVDPYLKKYNPKLPRVPLNEAATASAAVITHPHFDHFIDIGAFTEAGIKQVYVAQRGIDYARADGLSTEGMIALGAGEQLQIGDIAVRTFQSRHCTFDFATLLGIVLSPRTYIHMIKTLKLLHMKNKYAIGDEIYAVEFSHGGKRVMVLGSAGTDKNTQYPKGADLLVFPYQGRARMHEYMRPFLDRLEPKAVTIDHFDDAFPPFTHKVNTEKFIPEVKNRLPNARAYIPKENEWYEV